jgi:kynurenine 3-monooxygenase
LLALLDHYGADWGRVFRQFEQARKQDTDAIADLAVENFVEMRDLVADPRFLFRKRVELALEEKYPQKFVPKYAMVTFHRIPYTTAKKRGEIQDRILSEICTVNTIEDLDWRKADELIQTQLEPLELA